MIGVDWKSVGKNTFGVAHLAGGAVMSAFGMGSAAKSLTQMEQNAGLLPNWAGGSSSSSSPVSSSVTSADYVVVQYVDPSRKTDVLQNVAQVDVRGGNRIPGNGYNHGDAFGKTFSFGMDSPASVDITLTTGGQKSSSSTVQRILFCGGNETTPTKVAGYGGMAMSDYKVLGDMIAGEDGFTEIVGSDNEAFTEIVGEQNRDGLSEILGEDARSHLGMVHGFTEVLGTDPYSRVDDKQRDPYAKAKKSTAHLLGATARRAVSEDWASMDILGRGKRKHSVVGSDGPEGYPEIIGEAGHYLHGVDSIGVMGKPPAPAQPRGFVAKAMPGGVTTSLKFTKVKYGDHKTTIANARVAGQRAIAAAQRINAALQKLPPKGNMKNSALLKKVAADLTKTGNAALKQADKHEAGIAAFNQKQAANIQKMKGAMSAATKTVAATTPAAPSRVALPVKRALVHGDMIGVGEYEVLGRRGDRQPEYDSLEVLGAEAVADLLGVYTYLPGQVPNPASPGYLTNGQPDPGAQPDPANPGLLLNGTVDPNYAGGAGGVNAADPTGELAALPPQPTLASVQADFAQSGVQTDPYPTGNDQQVYHGVDASYSGLPQGAVVYDGSHGNNVNAFGSWSTFFGPGANANFQGGTGYFYGKQGWISEHGGSQAPMTNFGNKGLGSDILKAVNAQSLAMSLDSKHGGVPYGPLIGNPKNPNNGAEFANNLRFDADNGVFFWFYDKAPTWASGPYYQNMLNQALTQYAANLASAKTDNANANAQALLAQQQSAQLTQQQNLQDAQYQVQQDQQNNQLQLQQQQQQAQDDAFGQQYNQQQATAAQQYQAMQIQQQGQYADLDVQAQKQALDYYAQNPGAAPWAQPPQQDQGDGSDDGSGDGSGDGGYDGSSSDGQGGLSDGGSSRGGGDDGFDDDSLDQSDQGDVDAEMDSAV